MSARIETALRRLLPWILLPGLVAVGACTDTRESPAGQGNIRGIHALSDAGDITFLIEARAIQQLPLDYRQSSIYGLFDSLTYDFNFEYRSGITDSIELLATTELTMEPNVDYTMALVGSLQAPRIVTYEVPTFEQTGDATTLEALFLNLSPTAGDVDFYIGPEGLDTATVAPTAASVAPEALIDLGNLASDVLQVVVTPAGAPGAELIRTEAAAFTGDDRVFITLFDSAGESTFPYVVRLTGQNGAVTLVDESAPSRVQAIHTALAEGAIDLYFEPEEGALTTPVFSALSYGDVTALTDVDSADDGVTLDATITAAGNQGAILLEQVSAFPDGAPALAIVAGSQAQDNLGIVSQSPSRRPIVDAARVSVFTGVTDPERIDLYLIEPDDTFELGVTRPFLFNAVIGNAVQQFTTRPGVYELIVLNSSDDSIILGPVDLTLSAGDIRQLILTDSVDPNVPALFDIDLTAF